jgi:putative transposase
MAYQLEGMMKKRFSEEQIICILKEAEAIGNVREVCRQHNIAEQTLFRWRRKFGGMELSEAKRLRELERQNLQLKNMVAELSLDNRMLRDVVAKKW